MAGLCEGGNESEGSLKAICNIWHIQLVILELGSVGDDPYSSVPEGHKGYRLDVDKYRNGGDAASSSHDQLQGGNVRLPIFLVR
ncbi:hypothetical protein ANN_22027 [Periplaneta americana]|uniref:Uncharacterized protein n=1 Tax=Periplaneta americana TaxID=6978 RepID=A0ABQ8S701_PERAM|nr:hypothetical protein ANN_22027 [Periplaneta americana]